MPRNPDLAQQACPEILSEWLINQGVVDTPCERMWGMGARPGLPSSRQDAPGFAEVLARTILVRRHGAQRP